MANFPFVVFMGRHNSSVFSDGGITVGRCLNAATLNLDKLKLVALSAAFVEPAAIPQG